MLIIIVFLYLYPNLKPDYMRFTLLLSSFCLCFGLKAQTGDLLKEFINKNDIAIKNVQKNMIANNLSSYDSEFKSLIKKQENAVKSFSSNKEASASLAFEVREGCLD